MIRRYSQDIWDWILSGNPTPSFLRFAREENLEPLQPTESSDVPYEDSPPELVAHGRHSSSAHDRPGRARRRESRTRRTTSLEDRFPSPPVGTTRAKASAADTQSTTSSSGSLDGRLQEAALNTRSNRGPRSRADTLRPLRRSLSSESVIRAPEHEPSSVRIVLPNDPEVQASERISVPTATPENPVVQGSERTSVSTATPENPVVQGSERTSVSTASTKDPELTPGIQAVLKYQRELYKKPEKLEDKDPKAAERRYDEQVFRWCNVCTDDVTKPTWCTHPEYEGIAFDLLNDARLNRGKILVDGTEYVFDLPKVYGKFTTLFAMIHPNNLCNLLTENVQPDAQHWIVFTTNGTLLGYSEGTTIDQARTVAALTSTAWRINHDQVLKDLIDIPHSGLFLKDVEIFPYDQAEAGLRCMFAEVNDTVIAVHDVKERLLVAAMLPLDTMEPPVEEPIEEMKSLQVSETENESEEPEDVEEAAENVRNRSPGSHPSASSESSTASGDSKGKGKATGEEEEEEETYEGPAFSKKDVLMMKTEAMVEVLLQDLVEFVMPNEFY